MIGNFHRCSVVLRNFQQCLEISISPNRCSVVFRTDQRFTVLIIAVSALRIAKFLLCRNYDHGSFSCEIAISIENNVKCINNQFWNIRKKLFESLNQSAVSMIIAESSKGVNLGYSSYIQTPITSRSISAEPAGKCYQKGRTSTERQGIKRN